MQKYREYELEKFEKKHYFRYKPNINFHFFLSAFVGHPFYYSGLTDIGFVREKNEDAWKVLTEGRIFVLADGMGGLQGGDIASSRCVEYFCELAKKINHEIEIKKPPINEIIDLFNEAIEKVNSLIFEESITEYHARGMGTTLCALYLLNNTAIHAHVGDSRIYRFRNQAKRRLVQLTEDHSLANEFILHGELSKIEASHSPYKNILTRAIGIQPHVEPSVSCLPVMPGDLFLLCTDGLTNYVDDDKIEEVLLKIPLKTLHSIEKELKEANQELISLAKSQGGGDNITSILVLVA